MLRRKFPIALVLSLLLVLYTSAQTVTLNKPLADGTGPFAVEVGKWIEGPAADPAKAAAIEPFVLGLYGFKTLRTVNLGIGKLESMHMNISRIMLGVYDDELDGHLKILIDKGANAKGFYYPTDAEKSPVQKFVVQKYAAKYMGFTPDFTPVKQDPVAQWKFNVGSALGELASDVTGWHNFPNYPAYDKSMQDRLIGLEKDISSAPAGTPPAFLSDLRKLNALGTKAKFTYPERQAVAAALAQALVSARSIADVRSAGSAPVAKPTPTPKPITTPAPKPAPIATPTVTYLDKAAGTYQVTVRMLLGVASQLELRLTKVGNSISAEMTDSGGARTLKFDSFVVKPDGTYSFKLTHTNGAVWTGTGKFSADFSTLTGNNSHQASAGAKVSSSWSGKRRR